MPIDIQPPVLTVTDHYRLPVSEKRFGVCGLVSFENGCYDGVRFIDSTGKEWYVEGAENMGFTSWLQLLWWRKEYKSI